MATRFVICLAVVVASVFAAPAQTGKDQGPPAECEKPFGDGQLATTPSPYSFSVTAKQRTTVTDYKKTFKGAPIDMTITFTSTPGASAIQAFALRAGIPFPVVQWQKSGDRSAQIVSCIAPQSVDTLLVKGNVGQQKTAVAIPLLAAWANHQSLPVIYEMAVQDGSGNIYVINYNGTIGVQETDYVLPKQFFQPPPNANQQRGASGIANMNDARFQGQGMQQGGQQFRQQRDAAEEQESDQVDTDGN